jgi:hypothetical protein
VQPGRRRSVEYEVAALLPEKGAGADPNAMALTPEPAPIGDYAAEQSATDGFADVPKPLG